MTELTAGHAFSAGDWLVSRQIWRIVYSVARDSGLRREDAEDVGQDASFAVWKLRSYGLITAALVREIVRNKTRDLLRARGRERRRSEKWRESSLQEPAAAEAMLLLRSRVAKFPSDLRAFCQMHFVEGLSEREIAKVLEVPRGIVRGMNRVCQRVLGIRPGGQTGK